MKSVLLLIYFGTYSGGDSKGIYVADFDSKAGQIKNVRVAAETDNPSFLHIHPNGKTLYSVTESRRGNERSDAAVTAWKIEPDATLKLINRQPSGGDGPCYVSVSPDGKYCAAANYGSGSVSVYPIADDGSLGEATGFQQHQGSGGDARRQASPHAHSIQFDPSGRFVLSADLGADRLFVYKLADDGSLVPLEPGVLEPGSGPRHFAFSNDGRFVFVINEMTCTVTTFRYDAGKLVRQETVSTLPGEVEKGFSTAEILVHPSGKFVYGSNRGHDTIAVFALDQQTGDLSAVGHIPSGGQTPRNFRISPDGRWLLTANQSSGTVVVHRIDQETGMADRVSEAAVPKPVCIKFLAK